MASRVLFNDLTRITTTTPLEPRPLWAFHVIFRFTDRDLVAKQRPVALIFHCLGAAPLKFILLYIYLFFVIQRFI